LVSLKISKTQHAAAAPFITQFKTLKVGAVWSKPGGRRTLEWCAFIKNPR